VSSQAAEADVRLLNTANGLQTARLLTHREKKPAGSNGRGSDGGSSHPDRQIIGLAGQVCPLKA